jgi:hypothetical protein
MFLIGKYWTDRNGYALNLGSDDAADLMQCELGIEKRHYAAKRSLEVLEDPQMALKEYKDDLDKISVNMSKQFQDDLKDLLEIGYSPTQAERLALDKAEGWIGYQMAILDKKFPLVNDQSLLRNTVANKAVIKVEGMSKKNKEVMVKAKAAVEVKLVVEASKAHNSQLNLCQALCTFSRKSRHKPVTNKIITILFFSCSSIYNIYLPPSNIDELLNAPDYVPPVLRGRQIAKLIGQRAVTLAEIYEAQDRIAALVEEIREEAQRYEDNLVPVFNVGHIAGYKQGHKAGLKEAISGNREYGFKLGYVEAAKDLISGDNFILIDKKNPSKPIKAKSTNDLIRQIPANDPRYAGLRNEVLRDRKTGGLIDIYAKNSSWISVGNEILFLAKTRSYTQERGRITGKRIFKTLADQLDWKPDTSDFPTNLKSVLDPTPPGKYKPPDSKQVRSHGKKKFLEYKKGKK